MDNDTLNTLVHAFVTSRIDYSNALLYGLPDTMLSRVQRVQNCAAKIVTNGRKYDHVTPLLISLHWLPVRYRIMFKVICTVFKCLNGLAPSYLTDLICEYTPIRTLRSSGTRLVETPRSNRKTWGDRSFRVAGPNLWNSLPVELRFVTDIKVFKAKLKTYLFKMRVICKVIYSMLHIFVFIILF